MPSFLAVSSGLRAELSMPSESRTTAATSDGANGFEAAASALANEVALPVGVKAGRFSGPSSGSACSANAISDRRNVSLSLPHHFVSLSRAWFEPS